MAVLGTSLRTFVAEQLLARNPVSRRLFSREADRLAQACDEMSRRFLRGGRLLAFGTGAAATDAQHVAVEFVHPVIVGKRALPALDLSATFDVSLPAIVRESDIVMGFGGTAHAVVRDALSTARARGAMTFALPGPAPGYSVDPPSNDPFISQELIEILYHTLWETVHVFFERGERRPDGDVGASAFLYPFLGGDMQDTSGVLTQVAASIRAKAEEDERLREATAAGQAAEIASAAQQVRARINAGATLLMFGNGGSATDANDWAIDCMSPPRGSWAIPAISLSVDPANITAVANDVGVEAVFLRQLIAHGRRGDVAIAISTSGGSANVIAALEEARQREMLTVALLGYDGGEIVRRGLADLPIVVRSDYIPRIQEVQASIYHVLTEVWRQWRT
jgi:D-sedoheptulose 7-phosphate isomerase